MTDHRDHTVPIDRDHEVAHRMIRNEDDAQAHERGPLHGGHRYRVAWRIAGTDYARTLAAMSEADAMDRVTRDVLQSVIAVQED